MSFTEIFKAVLKGLHSAVAELFIVIIKAYQLLFAGVPSNCRFEPTCSTYAIQAIRKHGVFKGFGLAVWRILRCNPWNPGGYDPVR